jgi:hypothetical protein
VLVGRYRRFARAASPCVEESAGPPVQGAWRRWRRRNGLGRRFAAVGFDSTSARHRSQRLATLTVIALLSSSASAAAFSQRGHTFAWSFGGQGEGAGEFQFEGSFRHDEPAGIGVNEATGDVYVVDRGNYRVQEFGPEGQFIATWGWGVSDGKDEFEMCTSACRAGIPGNGKGQLQEAAPIAVDNSANGVGDVYVGADGAAKRPDVQRFQASGEEALGRMADDEEGRLDGLGVDARGDVWLYRGEEEEAGVIEGFTGAASARRLEQEFSSPLECPKPGFAVDAGGEDFYVSHELLDGEALCPAVLEREAAGEGRKLEGVARPAVVGKLNAAELSSTGGVAIAELERQSASAVAVDQASGPQTPLGGEAKGDVYVDEGDQVSVFEADGARIGSFGSGELSGGMGVAVDARTGNVFVIDASDDRVDVFEPEAAGKPIVEDGSALDVTPSEVKLSAQINPDGAETHYYMEYGTVECAGHPGACAQVPAAPGEDLGAGFGVRQVSQTLSGLQPATTYHYRVIASNTPYGSAEATEARGTFQTLPSAAGLLADHRAWELVSPTEKDGAAVEPFLREGGLVQAAPNGEAVVYVADGPMLSEPAGSRAPEPTEILSTRSQQGWSSQDLATPHAKGEGLEAGEPAEYRIFSEDLALSLVQPTGGNVEPLEAPSLAPGASEKTLYERADPPLQPSASEQAAYGLAQANAGFLAPGFAPLLTPAQVTGETVVGEKSRFGGKLEFLDATPDLARAVFGSTVPLLAGSSAGLYETGVSGGLELVSVLPGSGAPAPDPELGDENALARGAVSEDGSRVIFSSEPLEEGGPVGLYLRDTRLDQTLQLNAAQGVVEPTGEEAEVAFQGASANGSRVFFTDTAPLTAESRQRPSGEHPEADLYECEVVEAAGRLSCELKDLTAIAAGGSADVLNTVTGISQDGSDVYFVANGALAPGATQGDCTHQSQEAPPAGATCNLYHWHEGAIAFIATLSNEDSGDWGSLHGPGRVGGFTANRPDLADLTAGVSPNGEYLAFMSNRSLTGYDNTDANHASEGTRDEEVYLYDAASRLLTCVSCNSNGPSIGVHDVEHAGEGQGLVVDRRGDWSGAYLAGSLPGWDPLGLDRALHQPHYLSNSGRLFFDSPDQLVPQATNGKEDVYEYEPEGVGSCEQADGCVSLISSGSSEHESAFLEASETGDDAFFITSQPLVPADHDSNYDLYDARVCTASSPCVSSETASQAACETSRSCNTVSAPPPSLQPPATAASVPTPSNPDSQTPGSRSQSSAGTPKAKPSPAQQLASALRACRKKKDRLRRATCERQARRRYAPMLEGRHARAPKTAGRQTRRRYTTKTTGKRARKTATTADRDASRGRR